MQLTSDLQRRETEQRIRRLVAHRFPPSGADVAMVHRSRMTDWAVSSRRRIPSMALQERPQWEFPGFCTRFWDPPMPLAELRRSRVLAASRDLCARQAVGGKEAVRRWHYRLSPCGPRDRLSGSVFSGVSCLRLFIARRPRTSRAHLAARRASSSSRAASVLPGFVASGGFAGGSCAWKRCSRRGSGSPLRPQCFHPTHRWIFLRRERSGLQQIKAVALRSGGTAFASVPSCWPQAPD